MNINEIVKVLFLLFGGKDNIVSVVYCVICLCLVLVDDLLV